VNTQGFVLTRFFPRIQFKDGVFRVTTTKERATIVVSPKFLGELQKLPDDVISMRAAIQEVGIPPCRGPLLFLFQFSPPTFELTL